MTQPDYDIQPRRGLDFDLDGDIPRFWMDGDPFKTRFFDALSLLFPHGERFFIDCVRDFSDRITDPTLKDQVRDFIFQEGQHGQQHTRFNNRLKEQSVDVDRLMGRHKELIDWTREHASRNQTLAQTAASEHITAMMAHGIMQDQHLLDGADPRMRAMYNWHAVEEIEHKAVAYDVLTKVAKVTWFRRILGMLAITIIFPMHTFANMRHMLRVDGQSTWKVWLKGLWWLYGPRGLFTRWLPAYLHYYQPGFHPWHSSRKKMRAYERWLAEYERTGGDAVAASEHLQHKAAA